MELILLGLIFLLVLFAVLTAYSLGVCQGRREIMNIQKRITHHKNKKEISV